MRTYKGQQAKQSSWHDLLREKSALITLKGWKSMHTFCHRNELRARRRKLGLGTLGRRDKRASTTANCPASHKWLTQMHRTGEAETREVPRSPTDPELKTA
eukprot:927988-Pleurochrysis_carterae.AAC.1